MIAVTLLGLVLLIFIPARALWPRRADAAKRSLSRRLALTTFEIAAMLALLALLAPGAGLTFAAIGLDWPPPLAGQIGLAVATLVIVGFAAAVALMKPGGSPREQEALLPDAARR